jgi:hypothetical protein
MKLPVKVLERVFDLRIKEKIGKTALLFILLLLKEGNLHAMDFKKYTTSSLEDEQLELIKEFISYKEDKSWKYKNGKVYILTDNFENMQYINIEDDILERIITESRDSILIYLLYRQYKLVSKNGVVTFYKDKIRELFGEGNETRLVYYLKKKFNLIVEKSKYGWTVSEEKVEVLDVEKAKKRLLELEKEKVRLLTFLKQNIEGFDAYKEIRIKDIKEMIEEKEKEKKENEEKLKQELEIIEKEKNAFIESIKDKSNMIELFFEKNKDNIASALYYKNIEKGRDIFKNPIITDFLYKNKEFFV